MKKRILSIILAGIMSLTYPLQVFAQEIPGDKEELLLLDEILEEINSIKKACNKKILKVIIETCLLTKDEIIKMCEIVSNSNADFIKTSTGFSISGANLEDIKLMKEHIFNKGSLRYIRIATVTGYTLLYLYQMSYLWGLF